MGTKRLIVLRKVPGKPKPCRALFCARFSDWTVRTKLLILTTYWSNASLKGSGAPPWLGPHRLGASFYKSETVLAFLNWRSLWVTRTILLSLIRGYGGGDKARWREGNINYQVCSPLITISTHTMFCSSFGLFQFTNDSANQLLSAEAFLARKQSSIYKTEFKRWMHLGCRSPIYIYWIFIVPTRAGRMIKQKFSI